MITLLNAYTRRIRFLLQRFFLPMRRMEARLRGASVSKGVCIYGRAVLRLETPRSLVLSDHVTLNAATNRNSLEARGSVIIQTLLPTARITIGSHTGVTSATISAAIGISIGERVLIGAGALITDSDHHVVRPAKGVPRRFAGLPMPHSRDQIHISDDVFIGCRAIVLKGVHIGEGAVIGAGSVVTSDVEPLTIVAGNPAQKIGWVK